MPAQSDKQANAAKLAGAVKKGSFPKSKAGPAVKAMAKMPMSKLKHFMKKEMRDAMSEEQKRRLLVGLRKLKEGYAGGGNTDTTNADNLVAEMDTDTERHVVAKQFTTKDDFDSYVNRHRGIQMTPKEQQAIMGLASAKPNQQDNFFVKYENTDSFGTNQTVVIKKLKDGNQMCWTAFANYSKPGDDDEPEGEQSAGGGQTVNDEIHITKTINFANDDESSNILGDFLRELEL